MTQNNIYDELQALYESQLYIRGIKVLEKYSNLDIVRDLRLCNHKFRFQRFVGLHKENIELLKDIINYYKDNPEEEKAFKHSENPDEKWAYYEIHQYMALEKDTKRERFQVKLYLYYKIVFRLNNMKFIYNFNIFVILYIHIILNHLYIYNLQFYFILYYRNLTT